MNVDVKYWYLRDHKLFSQLSGDELKQLCVITGFKQAKKNEEIYFDHDDEQRVYFLKKGVLKIVQIDADGNEITKDILQKGDIFGEITLDDIHSNDSEFAKVVSDQVAICSFKLSDFEAILEKNPALCIKYTKLVGFKLKTIRTRFTDLIQKDVKTRLFNFLYELKDKYGEVLDGKTLVKHYLTHKDIAGIIGASRQTVTTLFKEFEEEGILFYDRDTITFNR